MNVSNIEKLMPDAAQHPIRSSDMITRKPPFPCPVTKRFFGTYPKHFPDLVSGEHGDISHVYLCFASQKIVLHSPIFPVQYVVALEVLAYII
jgi:hypothetical protein